MKARTVLRMTTLVSIILVEDDLPFVEILRHWLGDREIRVAGSLAEAERLIETLPPKYLLLDLSLPDSMPQQTLARIRSLKKAARDAIVIVITGYGDNRPAALESGADHALDKDDGVFAKLASMIPPPEGKPPTGTVAEIERMIEEIVAPPPPDARS
jgi:ActR/RegA family two-component response regulator